MNLDIRPILLVIGVLIATLGCAMMLPALADLMASNDDWKIFVVSGLITVLVGLGCYLSARGIPKGINVRQAFVMTASAWIVLPAFGALPFLWSGAVPSFTDAYFEAVSGMTTTGATVITGLDHLPPGIHLWRGLLQWLGGLGIIVMAIAILPMLQIGGMQLFKTEAFDTAEKIMPRAAEISGSITLIFVGLTGACAIGYLLAGMPFDDAVIHAMTTVATGGFSTKDSSIGYFNSTSVDTIAIVFMILGSMPFILYVAMIQGNRTSLFRDSQVRTFWGVLAILCIILLITRDFQNEIPTTETLLEIVLNVVSITTGTGYASADYTTWSGSATAFFFFIMFIGGCAGSTSCGIKIFRFQVIYQDVRQHIHRIVYPHGIFTKKYNGAPLSDNVSAAVMSFMFLFFACFAISATLLTLTGLDATTALSGAGSAISNVGPGLGEIIGPTGTYKPLNDLAKWILVVTMLIGRLEVFTLLVLFIPSFWRY